nr:BTB/POZ domain-containing protein At3g05675 [Ipomoea batatas]
MTKFGSTQAAELRATKDVFISAIRYATSIVDPSPPFGDELRTCAQEQVEFMLGDSEEILMVIADEEIKQETRMGLCKIFSSFEKALLSPLLLELDVKDKAVENKIMQNLSDVEWLCNILLKTDLMKDFVSHWADISNDVLRVVEDEKLHSVMWGLKVKLIEVTSKVLDAVGYGNVILPAPGRVHLLKAWLPYVRKMKHLLDSMGNKEADFPYRMDEELSQSIEGAIVSLVSALPSNSQAEILADWMNGEHLKYPDLSEAFEVWCYRTKSAKRRLLEALAESPLQFSASASD